MKFSHLPKIIFMASFHKISLKRKTKEIIIANVQVAQW